MSKLKPFHESIVDAIDLCQEKDIFILSSILVNTKIPKNHNVIIAAWEKKIEELSCPDYDVVDAILEQKKEAEEKSVDVTFLTDDPKIKSQLMQLGHSFSQVVAENNADLAESIRQEALMLKGETK
ncbi:hypothetical protein CVU82_01675 [Candidatus Falkowbacteria bacterium HGW-Falkowbacteria-1]|jgi:hypothetical protein|uniref:Uncharacterized protein n=1 Tax=Candidatus Falkowbacteria bacterium HGW-Falkowbacteria-1 TaxID=2013768 RepID=A0A2N2E9C0_9BACT|nr:MAG: hypothetical protein CVU82_01675 [Candidatus Falkowbacteria bacterium HGW-Falkowbacteria-1]